MPTWKRAQVRPSISCVCTHACVCVGARGHACVCVCSEEGVGGGWGYSCHLADVPPYVPPTHTPGCEGTCWERGVASPAIIVTLPEKTDEPYWTHLLSHTQMLPNCVWSLYYSLIAKISLHFDFHLNMKIEMHFAILFLPLHWNYHHTHFWNWDTLHLEVVVRRGRGLVGTVLGQRFNICFYPRPLLSLALASCLLPRSGGLWGGVRQSLRSPVQRGRGGAGDSLPEDGRRPGLLSGPPAAHPGLHQESPVSPTRPRPPAGDHGHTGRTSSLCCMLYVGFEGHYYYLSLLI